MVWVSGCVADGRCTYLSIIQSPGKSEGSLFRVVICSRGIFGRSAVCSETTIGAHTVFSTSFDIATGQG